MHRWATANPNPNPKRVGHSWRTGRDLFAVWDERAAREVLRLPDFLQVRARASQP